MTTWKAGVELDEIIKKMEQRRRLFDLYGLSLFCKYALFSEDFEPSAKWADCVKLTDQGRDYLKMLHSSGQTYHPVYEVFALFQLFYHHDLFIDYINTDINAILTLLSEMHKPGISKWPYIFGHRLYHKFNDAKSFKMSEDLTPQESAALLHDSPQGVFQTGKIVSGPLGFLQGQEDRVFPPTLKLTLWHCPDPGCQAEHKVSLCNSDSGNKEMLVNTRLCLFLKIVGEVNLH